MLFGAYVLLLPFQLAFFANFALSYFDAHGFHVAWQWWALALIAVTTTLCVLGLSPSLKVGLVGLAFEVIVFTIIAAVVLADGGASGLSLRPFDPSESALGFSGIIYGLVFAIFAFVGFESSTTLGEEAHEPHRTIPRAVLVTTLVIGVLYTLLIYVGVVWFGFSKHGLEALQSDGAPFSTLAETFVGTWLSTLATIAVMTSFLALNIVTITAAARMIYSMGRDRMLPSWFDHVNVRKSPDRAALVVGVFGIVVTLIFGSAHAPGEAAEWGSYIATLFFIVAYALLIIGVIRLYWRSTGTSSPICVTSGCRSRASSGLGSSPTATSIRCRPRRCGTSSGRRWRSQRSLRRSRSGWSGAIRSASSSLGSCSPPRPLRRPTCGMTSSRSSQVVSPREHRAHRREGWHRHPHVEPA